MIYCTCVSRILVTYLLRRVTQNNYYLHPDTYIGIYSVLDHTYYLISGVATPRNHPIWYIDMKVHVAGVYLNT